MKSANYWIEHLALTKHPEGGYFKETYRATEELTATTLPTRYGGSRCFGTSIYFLLKGEEYSAFHRLKSDEIWHFHTGSAATVYELDQESDILIKHQIGDDFERGQRLQVIIKAGNWFAAEVQDKDSYILVGCTVAPGFDFADFELANQTALLAAYPQFSELIERLT